MPNGPRRICGDAWAFTELLDQFSPHHRQLRHIARLTVGSDPLIEVVTSSLAVAEVAGLLRDDATRAPIGQLDLGVVERMWRTSPVFIQDVTLALANEAREIVRASQSARPRRRIIRGADAVYLATASLLEADTLITGDAALLAHSGMLGVRICLPTVLYDELVPNTTAEGDSK